MQTQDNIKMCYRKGNRKTRRKPLHNPLSRNRFTSKYSWSTRITKDPPSLVYPMYLSPPSSCYERNSRSLVFTSFPDLAIQPIASATKLLLPMLPNSTKTSLNTQVGRGKCLG